MVRRLLEKSDEAEESLFRLVGPECMGNRLLGPAGVGAGISRVGRVIDLLVEGDGALIGAVRW